MTPWEEVRSESTTIPAVRRANPLPWLLLALSLALTVTVLVLGRSRLGDERARTAAALKANDDVEARVREVQKQLDALKEGQAASELVKADVDKHVVELELTVQKLQAELDETKAALKEAERAARRGRR